MSLTSAGATGSFIEENERVDKTACSRTFEAMVFSHTIGFLTGRTRPYRRTIEAGAICSLVCACCSAHKLPEEH